MKMRHAAQIKNRYTGKTASEYDAKRMNETRWPLENLAVKKYLEEFPVGSSVLDIPVGTGRYADTYAALESVVTGLDTSPDMLALAEKAFENHGVQTFSLGKADILTDDLHGAYDVAVCTRLFNHFTRDEACRAMNRLLEVAGAVVFSVREPMYGSHPNWHTCTELLGLQDTFHSVDLDITVISERNDSRYVMARYRK